MAKNNRNKLSIFIIIKYIDINIQLFEYLEVDFSMENKQS